MSGANAVFTARDKQYRDLSALNADLVIGTVVAYCVENPNGRAIDGVSKLLFQRSTQPWTD